MTELILVVALAIFVHLAIAALAGYLVSTALARIKGGIK